MKAFAEKVSKNPYFAITGWLATIVALIIAIVLPIIQARNVSLSVSYSSNLLVTDKLSEMEGLDIEYKGNEIDQLSVTTCEICNTGNVIIEDADMYGDLILRINSDEGNVLFAEVVSQSYDTNNGQVLYDDNVVRVHFDILEKQEKIVINIYHTGNLSTVFSTDGRIKGGEIVPYSSDAGKPGIVTFIAVVMSVVAMIFSIFSRLKYCDGFSESFLLGIQMTITIMMILLLFYYVLPVFLQHI